MTVVDEDGLGGEAGIRSDERRKRLARVALVEGEVELPSSPRLQSDDR
jgi:hypothetical protein